MFLARYQYLQSSAVLHVLLLITYLFSIASSLDGGCKTTFAKIAGFAPSLSSPAQPLYASTYGHAITAECYNKCKSESNCSGFILHYAKATCYRVEKSSGIGYVADYRPRQHQLLSDPGVSYFIKTCLLFGDECVNRAWVVDLIPGYELMTTHHTIIPNSPSWEKCSERCIEATGCSSANYEEVSNTCSLSDSDSWADPQALAPVQRTTTDYIDNQCVPNTAKYCWHEPIYNQSSIRIDLSYDGASRQQCEMRCETNAYFKCLAYSWIDGTAFTKSQCHLHSDAVLDPVGPTIKPNLTPHLGAVYYERIKCTNVSVTCDANELLVTLVSPKFKGQMYVEGHSDACHILGSGQDVTVFRIPLGQSNPCDIQYAYALSRTTNRTMLSTVVVVQYHRQIQLLGDAVVKVSCYLGTGSGESSSDNITVGTSVSVNTQAPQTEVTGTGNGTVAPPIAGGNLRAQLRIIDERTNQELSGPTQIGDPLQLQIHIDPPYNISNVRAGHLVAKSGSTTDDTLLLLNWEGCPPDPKVFPGLTKGKDSNELVGKFKAFRFPSSSVLMLSVHLTFCPTGCPITDCGNGILSYGRKKREVQPEPDFEEIPLHIMLIVRERNDSRTPDPGRLEVDPTGDEVGQVCLSFVALSLVALFFLLIQAIIMTIVCWYLGKREKETADTISLRRDFSPQTPLSHRVTWADEMNASRPNSSNQQSVLY